MRSNLWKRASFLAAAALSTALSLTGGCIPEEDPAPASAPAAATTIQPAAAAAQGASGGAAADTPGNTIPSTASVVPAPEAPSLQAVASPADPGSSAAASTPAAAAISQAQLDQIASAMINVTFTIDTSTFFSSGSISGRKQISLCPSGAYALIDTTLGSVIPGGFTSGGSTESSIRYYGRWSFSQRNGQVILTLSVMRSDDERAPRSFEFALSFDNSGVSFNGKRAQAQAFDPSQNLCEFIDMQVGTQAPAPNSPQQPGQPSGPANDGLDDLRAALAHKVFITRQQIQQGPMVHDVYILCREGLYGFAEFLDSGFPNSPVAQANGRWSLELRNGSVVLVLVNQQRSNNQISERFELVLTNNEQGALLMSGVPVAEIFTADGYCP
ncbi:MAG: hypothetical protein IPM64_07550 [Phycisphaerales bacterium]|nr:hypothetical protein [Phycisphaerales bacterium]